MMLLPSSSDNNGQLWPGVNRPPVVNGLCLGPRNFYQACRQFSEVASCLHCPFMPCQLSPYRYFVFVISVSTVPLNSDIKLLTCSNGEQCCPLGTCTGSICTLLYTCNVMIVKCELLLGNHGERRIAYYCYLI